MTLTEKAQRLSSIKGRLILFEVMAQENLTEDKKLIDEVQEDLYRLRDLEKQLFG